MRPDDGLTVGSWKAFFRPVKSSRPGTMPAGTVLFVFVVAMVVAMFGSADLIQRRAEGRRNNFAWRITVSDAVAWTADAFKLSAPANALDEAVGPSIGHERKTTQGDNLDELLAASGNAEGAVTQSGPGTTVVDYTPKIAAPTAQAPLKLWVGGDSLSSDLANSMESLALKSKLFTVTKDPKVSTGLTRPDYFNWPEHLVRDVVPGVDPDVMVLLFGANDAQNIPMPPPIGGYTVGSEDWLAEYRDRVGKTMDLLRSPTNDRLVIWVGTPPMGPNSGVRVQPEINYIYWSEAQKRPWVQYFDTWPFFAAEDGSYALQLPNADGQTHVMRAGDNIHFNSWGADRAAAAVWAKLSGSVDLSASAMQLDPAKSPPPEIRERDEVPPDVEGAP